jgi:hypothetical protein
VPPFPCNAIFFTYTPVLGDFYGVSHAVLRG